MISSFTTVVDPWVVPDQSNIDSFSDRMLLIPVYHSLDYGTSFNPFSRTFSTYERIMEIMMPDDAHGIIIINVLPCHILARMILMNFINPIS